MFNAQAALAALLAQEFTTPIRVALPGAQLALDAERQRLDEAQEGDKDPSTKKCPVLTNNERQYVVHLLVKEEKEDSGNLRKGSIKEVVEILDVHPRTYTYIPHFSLKMRLLVF